MICQVIKKGVKERVTEVRRKTVCSNLGLVHGMLALTQGGGEINAAYIERLNATFRNVLTPLARRGRAILHQEGRLKAPCI